MSGSEACGGPEPWRPRNPPSRIRPRSRPRRRRRTPPVPTRTAGALEADLGGDRGGRSGGGVREWPTLTGSSGRLALRFRGGCLVPRAPPGGQTASSFVFLNPLLQDTSCREPSGTLFAAAPAPGRVAAPQAWCCGSRGPAATLRRDQDRSSAAKEPYSCIKVLFSPLLRRRGA